MCIIPEDVCKTTFAMVYGTFMSNVMQQGDCNAPSTVAHKTVPMFGHFGQMDLVQSDDIIQDLGPHVQQSISSWLSNKPGVM